MAVANAAELSRQQLSSEPESGSVTYVLPMVLMVSLYFSIGFITALNDILVAHFKQLFSLTNVLATDGSAVLFRGLFRDVSSLGRDYPADWL